MPVRSLSSAVFKWPDRETVLAAARAWAQSLAARHPEVAHVWAVGSYARGDWGVGSDLDLIVILTHTTLDRLERLREYQPPSRSGSVGMPVPVDLWVHTLAEWQAMSRHSPNLWRHLNESKLDLLRGRPD